MKNKLIYIKDIIDYLGNDVITVHGMIGDMFIDNLADSDHINETTLDWINSRKANKEEIALSSRAKCILVDESVQYTIELRQQDKVLLVVKKPRWSMAKIAGHFFLEKMSVGIHQAATVSSKAIISETASIGAGCVIGNATIGDGTVLMPNVVVYDNVIIGSDCLIQAGAVIGTDGLGCSRDEEGRLLKFPHLGGVVIGDDVEIGANSQIARGVLSDTIIEDGCKLNGLCFLSHNCHLEENVWITGNTMLCGSVYVGKNSTIFSGVTIRDQRVLGEHVTIGMGAIVTKNVPSGETWVGNPAKKLEK
jgi:UDP-3-O-[3-hydroxymyristoyl] glucosamine N-acyltransferase